MKTVVSALGCAGCDAVQPDIDPHWYPFRCVRADELPEVDHVVRRTLDTSSELLIEHDENPFLRYRRFLHSYHFAREHGLGDEAFVDLVRTLDESVARVDGRGFLISPIRRSAELESQLGIEGKGSVWIKDQTGDVSGSHKARHLFGVMLYLEVVRALGLDDPRRRGLAIASCGNAALAAAVVARAAGYSLRVFVPTSASAAVIARIDALGADVEFCQRQPGKKGDPAFLRFRDAVRSGALPFCCQGSENGLTIEGGETLWLEVAEALAEAPPDRVFVQVGGGALASTCVQAFTEMQAIGGLARLPRVHGVQTRGAFPLKRAYDRVREHNGHMGYARTHRSEFMWPWEAEPRSIAHGILDDETYDWAAVVEGMLRTGGSPLVVDEAELREANSIARETTGINVDHTGSAGLAGLMQLLRTEPAARREQMVVLFSGVRRR